MNIFAAKAVGATELERYLNRYWDDYAHAIVKGQDTTWLEARLLAVHNALNELNKEPV